MSGTLVRIKSHRAGKSAHAIIGKIQYYFVLCGHNDYAYIPDEYLERVLSIKSVGRARHPAGLMKCWE